MNGPAVSLTTMLGCLAALVIVCLAVDYSRFSRGPFRLAFGLALTGIVAGGLLIFSALDPASRFYGPALSEGLSGELLVALTFDDGPCPPYTGQILDILREENARASFFVVGRHAAAFPGLVRRMAVEGHQIGNHTWHHTDLLTLDRSAIADEVCCTGNLIAGIAGSAPRIVRPPHGFRDPAVMNVMAGQGLTVVGWSVMSRDWTNPGVDAIVSRTVGSCRDGAIIPLHDGDGAAGTASRAQTVAALRPIVRELRARGYRFVTVDEILARRDDP